MLKYLPDEWEGITNELFNILNTGRRQHPNDWLNGGWLKGAFYGYMVKFAMSPAIRREWMAALEYMINPKEYVNFSAMQHGRTVSKDDMIWIANQRKKRFGWEWALETAEGIFGKSGLTAEAVIRTNKTLAMELGLLPREASQPNSGARPAQPPPQSKEVPATKPQATKPALEPATSHKTREQSPKPGREKHEEHGPTPRNHGLSPPQPLPSFMSQDPKSQYYTEKPASNVPSMAQQWEEARKAFHTSEHPGRHHRLGHDRQPGRSPSSRQLGRHPSSRQPGRSQSSLDRSSSRTRNGAFGNKNSFTSMPTGAKLQSQQPMRGRLNRTPGAPTASTQSPRLGGIARDVHEAWQRNQGNMRPLPPLMRMTSTFAKFAGEWLLR